MTDVQLNIFDYNNDGLSDVFGSLGRTNATISNPITGIGTDRDSSQYVEVTHPRILTHDERVGLVTGSRICQNIVQVYPMEASWGQFNFSGNRYADRADAYLQSYFANFKFGSLHRCFVEASIEARLHGESYLLLGVEDGNPYDQPLDFNNISSFTWAKVFPYNQVTLTKDRPDLYEITLKDINRHPDFSLLRSDRKIRVHKDRLLMFVGDYLPPSILQVRKRHQSSLQSAFNGLCMALQAIMSVNAMLNDHSLFWYKLDGLASLVKAKKHDELFNRFLTLQLGKSVLKGLALDAKAEDVGFINRNYTGIKDVLETLLDYLVAETGLVRYKVLGTSSRAGLGAEGRGVQDRLEHSLKIKSWQQQHWKDHLLYCAKLALLCKDSLTGGRLPTDLAVTFPPVLELDPLEISKVVDANVSWATKAIDAGILTPLECRQGLFTTTDNHVTPLISLDPRYTEVLSSELEAQIDPEIDEEASYDDPDEDRPSNFSGEKSSEELLKVIESSIIEVKDQHENDYYLVFYEGRNTAQVVTANNREEAIRIAKKRGSTGSKGKVIEARKATDDEVKKIRKGQWVRTRPKKYGGTDQPKKSDPFKYRPQLRKTVKEDSLQWADRTEDAESEPSDPLKTNKIQADISNDQKRKLKNRLLKLAEINDSSLNAFLQSL
jgi:hypothetical protein